MSNSRTIRLFIGTFVSTLLLAFGVGVLGSMFLPAIVSLTLHDIDYQPQLPIAEARDEEDQFIDIDSIPAKQLFPELSNPTPIEEGNWIRIPSIGVNVPLAASPTLRDADVIDTLEFGAALYPNGIEPGRLGNTFIAAHSTGEPWKGKYRFAFLRINEIQDGNEIHLDYQGTRYTYRVFKEEIVTPSPDFQVVSDRPVPTVTLMACWPLWTTNQRMLITGELTNITKLTEKPF